MPAGLVVTVLVVSLYIYFLRTLHNIRVESTNWIGVYVGFGKFVPGIIMALAVQMRFGKAANYICYSTLNHK